MSEPREIPTYYDLPTLKAPVWRWEIWLYFFLGGLAGAAYAIAGLATLFGGGRARRIERAGYLVAFLTVLPCPPLLIKDLGRPRLFLNMLRVFKPESPMSVGVWGLLGFSGFATLAFLREAALALGGPLAGLARLVPQKALAPAGSAFAFFLAGYTGVLLSVTSVPLWSKSFLLAPTFLASSFASAASAIALALTGRGDVPREEIQQIETLKRVAVAAEVAALGGYLLQEGGAAKPLLDPSVHGRPFLGGALGLGILLPLALSLGGHSRGRIVVTSLLSLLGGLALRYAVVMGGHASAANPRTYLDWTRKE
ncbi:MAG TPA: NrfD/PsrC family molybdoenzyme membrane anchor subunit [Chloroflexota bacterium]|nr:NrfD/PsrC family molybdoenzyme membrane anchor subunit [Chloroflexota bacterium]